ncbi:MAG: PilZ domain-containing protein [Bdellovibrionales bacterium]|nr:PilZ domain-containing protein [Bdellovibrionales bacterium]
MNEYLNRREHDRHDFSSTPWVLAVELSSDLLGDAPLRLEGRNIGFGGMKFQTNRRIPLKREVLIHLFSREKSEPVVHLKGRVVRVEEVDEGLEEKSYGIAVRFEDLSPDAMTALSLRFA